MEKIEFFFVLYMVSLRKIIDKIMTCPGFAKHPVRHDDTNNTPPPYSRSDADTNGMSHNTPSDVKATLNDDDIDIDQIVKCMLKINEKNYSNENKAKIVLCEFSSKSDDVLQETSKNKSTIEHDNRILHDSVLYDNLNMFKHLIDNDADIDNAFRYSIIYKRLANLEHLHKLGFDIYRNNYALRIIVEVCCLEIHKRFENNTIVSKANVIEYCRYNGYLDIIQYFIRNSTNINATKITAIGFGTTIGHADIIWYLMTAI
jgi:hypothetical protein